MKFTIDVRIPGWARNEAVPGDLYKFSIVNEPVTLKVNEEMPVKLDQAMSAWTARGKPAT